MTIAHTPGPWSFDDDSPRLTMGDCVLPFQVWGGARIAFIESQNVGIEQAEANARLIAAAPEMGELLLSAFLHVTHGGPTREQVEVVLKKAGLL